jgi:thioredoxin-related protein
MKKITLILATLLITGSVFSQAETINWLTIDQALEQHKKNPKKFFFDVYTDWCGWCKVMDKNTFTNPVIIKYMNKHFYAIKFNAESAEKVVFNGTDYINPNPGPRSAHQFAAWLLKGRMGYPSFAFVDEKLKLINNVSGYHKPAQFEPVVNYYGSGEYLKKEYPLFQQGFKGEIKE